MTKKKQEPTHVVEEKPQGEAPQVEVSGLTEVQEPETQEPEVENPEPLQEEAPEVKPDTEESYFEEEVPVEEEFSPEILGSNITEPEKSEADIIREKERALRKR